jgi:hypothetical protein
MFRDRKLETARCYGASLNASHLCAAAVFPGRALPRRRRGKGSRASSGSGHRLERHRQAPPPKFAQALSPRPAPTGSSAQLWGRPPPLWRPPPHPTTAPQSSVCAAGSRGNRHTSSVRYQVDSSLYMNSSVEKCFRHLSTSAPAIWNNSEPLLFSIWPSISLYPSSNAYSFTNVYEQLRCISLEGAFNELPWGTIMLTTQR